MILPTELEARHLYSAVCTLARKAVSSNLWNTRVLFASTVNSPGTSSTGVPSPRIHSTEGAGRPKAVHAMDTPLVLAKLTTEGGLEMKTGPRGLVGGESVGKSEKKRSK